MAFIRMIRAIPRRLRQKQLVRIVVTCSMAAFLFVLVFRKTIVAIVIKSVFEQNSSDNKRVRMHFQPVTHNKDADNVTFDNVHLYPCSQPDGPGSDGYVDLMCMPRPNFLPGYKNPCIRDSSQTLKCLPYYMLLGFDKSGTTDLYSRLTAHPSIIQANAYIGKEIYYWCWRRFGMFLEGTTSIMTMDAYMYAFRDAAANLSGSEGKPNQLIVGDGGPIDGWDFRAWSLDPQNKGLSEPKVLTPHYMRHIFKNPRFIFVMREPAERLYSDYFFLRSGDTPEQFDRDVNVAVSMMDSCLLVNSTRQCFFSESTYRGLPTRLHIGCYSVFLREWFAVFHRKHFFLIRTEDYNKEMKESLQALYSFLGVETLPDSMIDHVVMREKKMENTRKKEAGPMLDRTKKLLKDFYAQCNADLTDLLEDDRYLWLDS